MTRLRENGVQVVAEGVSFQKKANSSSVDNLALFGVNFEFEKWWEVPRTCLPLGFQELSCSKIVLRPGATLQPRGSSFSQTVLAGVPPAGNEMLLHQRKLHHSPMCYPEIIHKVLSTCITSNSRGYTMLSLLKVQIWYLLFSFCWWISFHLAIPNRVPTNSSPSFCALKSAHTGKCKGTFFSGDTCGKDCDKQMSILGAVWQFSAI